MSVNIQTKTGLLKVAETCHCESESESGSETAAEAAYSAQPVEMIADEAGLGDYMQFQGYIAYSPEDIAVVPVKDISDLYAREV